MDSKFYLESIFYLPNRGQPEPKKSKWLTFNTNDSLKKLFPPKCAERTEIHRISGYNFRTDVHFAVIFKNTKYHTFGDPRRLRRDSVGKLLCRDST